MPIGKAVRPKKPVSKLAVAGVGATGGQADRHFASEVNIIPVTFPGPRSSGSNQETSHQRERDWVPPASDPHSASALLPNPNLRYPRIITTQLNHRPSVCLSWMPLATRPEHLPPPTRYIKPPVILQPMTGYPTEITINAPHQNLHFPQSFSHSPVAMADLSRTTSAVEGFSVYQPALGSPLQFLPAVGTKELEQLIGAYLPGPGSAQEKRATISMDFFEHSRLTGENFKYYAVVTHAAATPDSAYKLSPVVSDLSFYSSPSQTSTPAVAAPAAKKPRAASQKPTRTTDFSHLPGMKILTADGQDVTNSVSRGCKSKEQRDHAHLMRILKACDACKKKKVKCDPSHKKRPASQVESKSEAAKPAKRSRKTAASSPREHSTVFTPAPEASFQIDSLGLSGADFSATINDESWDQFLTFQDEPVNVPIPQDFYCAVPQDFDFFFGMDSSFSPSTSGSSVSSAQPLTPVSSGLLPQANDFSFSEDNALVFLQSSDNSQEPNLPYLNPAGQLGSNYVDFNLFSPASSFIDEEPQSLKSAPASQTHSPASLSDQLPSGTGLAREQQSRFERHQSQSRSALSPGMPDQRVPGLGQAGGLAGELTDSLPYHADDVGHNTARSVGTVTRLRGPQIHSHTSLGSQHLPVESPSGDSGLNRQPSSTVASASVIPQGVSLRVISQNATPVCAGNADLTSQTVSPTVWQPRYPSHSMTIMLTSEKENRYLDPGRRRADLPDLPDLSTARALQSPQASSSVVEVSRSRSAGSLSTESQGITSQGGVSSGLSLLRRRAPEGPRSSAIGNATIGLSQASRIGVEGVCLADSRSGSALVCQQRGLGSANVNAELPLQGLVLCQGLPQHPAPAPKPALLPPSADSAPLSSPARQLLVAGSSSEALPAQLAAFGFVSMLLSVLMVVVVVTTLHQQRTQNQAQAQNILTGLPSIPAVFLALLSKAAPASTAYPQKRSGGILGRVRDFLSPVARVVPLLSSRC